MCNKMKLNILLSNSERTIGLVSVTGFSGSRTTVNLEFLKRAIKALDDLTEKGLTPVKLTVGIESSENQDGMFILFLDKEEKTGIAIAPLFAREKSDGN